jgi:hypothetical protein
VIPDVELVFQIPICKIDQIIVLEQCLKCPSTTVKLDPLSNVCEDCQRKGVLCEGNIINVTQGYSRASKDSVNVTNCPFPHACNGGIDFGS